MAKIKASFKVIPLAACGERTVVRFLFVIFFFTACSSQHKSQQSRQPNSKTEKSLFTNDLIINDLLIDSALAHAHVGVCVYDVEAKKYIHQYNDDKYFVPASNTKLFTCYAAMKYLGDSLVGLRFDIQNGQTLIQGTGDPTFLHSDFQQQRVYNFLKRQGNISYLDVDWLKHFSPLGDGWAWNDYAEAYMPERSEFPIYGNCAFFYMQGDSLNVMPHTFYNSNITWQNKTLKNGVGAYFKIIRPLEENFFHPLGQNISDGTFSHQHVPFKTIANTTYPFLNPVFLTLLCDTLNKKIGTSMSTDGYYRLPNVIHSQPTDSLLKITMHRSDNFFAEQTLLMVSNEKLGFMSDEKIIDTLLKTDLKDLPQLPNWVDGSGLSRYDLFTPQDFVAILEKIKNEFGLARIENILPTGNTGTLAGLYKNLSGKIFAKTGTLGNQVALSGYLITQKGKLLIFSVLVNNHMNSAGNVRRAVEKFLNQVWERE